MFSELEQLRPPAGRPCDNHVIGAWLSRQLISSECMVFRIPVERERDSKSLYHSSLLEFVLRFGRQNRRLILRFTI